MYKTIGILATSFTLAFYVMTSMAQNQANVVKVGYSWLPGKLIPNEFALADGTWSNSSIRECVSKCSAQKACSGFSVKKSMEMRGSLAVRAIYAIKKQSVTQRVLGVQVSIGCQMINKFESPRSMLTAMLG